jgi:di/tricarboxylate transporter
MSWILIALSVVIPILALIIPYPHAVGLDRSGWFARSGALTTVFAILAEGVLVRAKLSITPVGFGWSGLQEQRDKFIPRFNGPEWLIFTLTILGTLIWGYGDIPFNISG